MTVFTLTTPIDYVLSGAQGPTRRGTITEVILRPARAMDLRLLDQYKGQPATLALHATVALSRLTLAQVKKIEIDDYEPIAIAVLKALSNACIRLGLNPDYFIPADAKI